MKRNVFLSKTFTTVELLQPKRGSLFYWPWGVMNFWIKRQLWTTLDHLGWYPLFEVYCHASPSVGTFRRKLKAYLFSEAYTPSFHIIQVVPQCWPTWHPRALLFDYHLMLLHLRNSFLRRLSAIKVLLELCFLRNSSVCSTAFSNACNIQKSLRIVQ